MHDTHKCTCHCSLKKSICLHGTICTYNMELRLEYVNMVQYVRIICVTQEMKIHMHDIYIFTHMNHVCIDKACLMQIMHLYIASHMSKNVRVLYVIQ